jgi:protein associated with RNAse G/E
VDLDLDILVAPDFTYQILDEEEFERNATLYGHENELRTKARLALEELIVMIDQRAFPFQLVA